MAELLSSQSFEKREVDVLVVGAGGAGLRAAIEASACKVKVGLVCKSLLGKAHTVMAEGGVAAALANVESEDSWQVHFRDTMRGGKMLNHWRMAELHAKEAPERVRELERWGAAFDRTADGRILQRNFGGHRFPRLAHVGDRTGLEMIRTLQDKGVHQGIEVFMECTIYALLKDGNRVTGALGYYRETGRFVLFQAKALILATGGIGKAYLVTSNSWEYTGDGHALGYLAGAEVMDMEFIQFHPTGMVWPPSIRGTLVTEAVRGEGGVLRNAYGERFMFRYIPEAFKPDYSATEEEANRWLNGDKTARRPPELLTRDVVARAINREIKEGRGSPHGGVFLDIATRRSAEDIRRRLPSMYHQFKELGGVDITREPMEIGPTTHYVMGGLRVNPETAETTVEGLYAAGECAAGMHGANRLGGNSLGDLLVFGKRAGEAAAERAQKHGPHGRCDENEIKLRTAEMLEPFQRATGENPYALTETLQSMMQSLVGIIRVEKELLEAKQRFGEIQTRARQVRVTGNRQFNPGWHQALDLRNLLIVSEMSIAAAFERRESRGAHTRSDFPDLDPEFGKVNIILKKTESGMSVKKETRPSMPAELQKLFEGDKV